MSAAPGRNHGHAKNCVSHRSGSAKLSALDTRLAASLWQTLVPARGKGLHALEGVNPCTSRQVDRIKDAVSSGMNRAWRQSSGMPGRRPYEVL